MTNSDSQRPILRPVALLVLLTMILPALACNFPGQANAQPTLALQPNTPIATITLGPTATLFPTATFPPPSPTPPLPTATITLTPTFSPGFQEQFDAEMQGWTDYVVLTTQAAAGRLTSSLTQSGGWLTLALNDQETYLYRFFKAAQPADIFVEFEFMMDGQMENDAALVCRASPDQSQWYEARIAGNGEFAIYRYEKARKTNQGLNPYILLARGSAAQKAYDRGELNLVRFTCQGTQLTLDFNLGSQRYTTEDDALSSGGLVGFGAMTYSQVPVTIQIDEINAGLP